MNSHQAHFIAVSRLSSSADDRDEVRATVRILLDTLLETPHAHLTRADEVLSPRQIERLETALSELETGRPLPYVLGRGDFYGLAFNCDERALIPRPETELLVDFALEQLKTRQAQARTLRVADLGTGTGCIPIAIAKNSANVEILATDAFPEALSLARENAALHDVSERIEFVPGVLGDWAAPLCKLGPEYSGSFDVIVSNPPYIAPRDIEELQVQVRKFEPRSALDGGEDGLDCYRQLAAQCKVLLRPDGIFACELGAGQFEDVRAIFDNAGWRVENPILDFAGIARVLVARPQL